MLDDQKHDELTEQLKLLIKKLDKPQKNLVGWFTLFTTFLGTVVIAGLSLYFSNQESQRSHQNSVNQFELDKSKARVEELKALSALIPSLSSKDSNERNTALLLLQSTTVKGTKSVSGVELKSASNNLASTGATNQSIIDEFYTLLLTARSTTTAPAKRAQAVEEIGKFIVDKKVPIDLREQGADVVATIAAASSTPESLRQTAGRVLANIKQVALTEMPQILEAEQITRSVKSIILHHIGPPYSLRDYKGAQTVLNIAKFQVNGMGWKKVSWHYALAPDGTIWLGTGLNDAAIHTPGQDDNSVSILLMIDGDKEFPTDQQKATLTAILRLLYVKLKLTEQDVYPHSHYNARKKPCPGALLNDQYVNEILRR